MGDENNELVAAAKSDPVVRAFSILALLLGAGSGAITVQMSDAIDEKTTDRITYSETAALLEVRDVKISANKERAQDNRRSIQKLDDNSPPKQLVDQLVSLAGRVRNVERELDRNNRD